MLRVYGKNTSCFFGPSVRLSVYAHLVHLQCAGQVWNLLLMFYSAPLALLDHSLQLGSALLHLQWEEWDKECSIARTNTCCSTHTHTLAHTHSPPCQSVHPQVQPFLLTQLWGLYSRTTANGNALLNTLSWTTVHNTCMHTNMQLHEGTPTLPPFTTHLPPNSSLTKADNFW